MKTETQGHQVAETLGNQASRVMELLAPLCWVAKCSPLSLVLLVITTSPARANLCLSSQSGSSTVLGIVSESLVWVPWFQCKTICQQRHEEQEKRETSYKCTQHPIIFLRCRRQDVLLYLWEKVSFTAYYSFIFITPHRMYSSRLQVKPWAPACPMGTGLVREGRQTFSYFQGLWLI